MIGVQSVGIQRVGQDTTKSYSLQHDDLAHSTSGLWFWIWPFDGHEDKICVRTGIKWQYLLTLLTKYSLLCSRVTSLVKDDHCNITQWDEMAKLFSSKSRMELTCIWMSLWRRCYFYCIGRPIYWNPLYQQQVFGTKMELSVKKPSLIYYEGWQKLLRFIYTQFLAWIQIKVSTAQWCSLYVYMCGMNGLFVHYEVVYT